MLKLLLRILFFKIFFCSKYYLLFIKYANIETPKTIKNCFLFLQAKQKYAIKNKISKFNKADTLTTYIFGR